MDAKVICSFLRDDDSGYIYASPDGTFLLFYKTLCGLNYEFEINAGYVDLMDAFDDLSDLYNKVGIWQEYIGMSRRIL